MKKEFKMEPIDEGCDKEITIYSSNLCISVDYDDVNHKRVEKDVKKMIDILNKHWKD